MLIRNLTLFLFCFVFFLLLRQFDICEIHSRMLYQTYYPHYYKYVWGQRIWQPQPTLYYVQGPRRRRTKKVQITKKHRRGQSCSRPIEIIEGKSGTPSKVASQNIPRKRKSTVGQPWEFGGGAIQGENVTSTLNSPN